MLADTFSRFLSELVHNFVMNFIMERSIPVIDFVRECGNWNMQPYAAIFYPCLMQ